jgi:hypothetical protein
LKEGNLRGKPRENAIIDDATVKSIVEYQPVLKKIRG